MKFKDLRGSDLPEGESSEKIRERVLTARERQLQRFEGEGIFANAVMSPKLIRKFCELDDSSEKLLESAMLRQGLSARAHDRILKVARTIADLDGIDQVQATHLSEAISYRSLDRTFWN